MVLTVRFQQICFICFNGNAEGIDNFYFDIVIESFIDIEIPNIKTKNYIFILGDTIFN